MIDPVVMALSMIIIGQICLSVPLLLIRAKKYKECSSLALFLVANGLILMVPTVNKLFPEWYQFYTALSFPALFMLCPSLWFYVKGITAEQAWKPERKQAFHYALLIPGVMISVMILFLPENSYKAIFIENADVMDPFAIVLVVSILIMMLLWLGQCAYTFFRIIHRLVAFRKQLKNWFSNNRDKQLTWINWLLFIAMCTWVFSLMMVLSSNLFDDFLFSIRIEALFSLFLIWCLAHFGLQQKPIFTSQDDNEMLPQVLNKDEANNEGVKPLGTAKKYQRSALGTDQAERIANKITESMKKDKLYLDANLSLQKLAKHVAISPNYISQTLNETLNVNFFDFVNRWRIEAAKPQIVANQDTVLNIAFEVGFNARSSFYKAFKLETGKTPSEFRKNNN